MSRRHVFPPPAHLSFDRPSPFSNLPFSLHISNLYVVNPGVVKGDHPVSKEEAFNFAALQCQIVYGNFTAEKHNKAFFKEKKIEELVSITHRKTKGTVKRKKDNRNFTL